MRTVISSRISRAGSVEAPTSTLDLVTIGLMATAAVAPAPQGFQAPEEARADSQTAAKPEGTEIGEEVSKEVSKEMTQPAGVEESGPESGPEGTMAPGMDVDFLAKLSELFGNPTERQLSAFVFSLAIHVEAKLREDHYVSMLEQYGGAMNEEAMSGHAAELNELATQTAKRIISGAEEKRQLVDEATIKDVARARELCRKLFAEQLKPTPMTPEEIATADVKQLARHVATLSCASALRDLSGAAKATLADAVNVGLQLGEKAHQALDLFEQAYTPENEAQKASLAAAINTVRSDIQRQSFMRDLQKNSSPQARGPAAPNASPESGPDDGDMEFLSTLEGLKAEPKSQPAGQEPAGEEPAGKKEAEPVSA